MLADGLVLYHGNDRWDVDLTGARDEVVVDDVAAAEGRVANEAQH